MLKPRRSALSAIAGCAVVSFLLVGCGSGGDAGGAGQPSAGASEIQTGGVAQIAALTEMQGFDPVKVTNVGSGLERAAAIMDTLLYRDELTDEVFPKLAEGISSADGQTWVLELREGVEFTDGTALDAEAVIFNLQRHIAPDSTSTAKAMLSAIDTMTATDEYEVTITLTQPSGSFPLALTGSSPASLIGSPTALADPETFNANPVGAGAFVLESWVRDDTLTLTRNEDYWDEGKPYLDGVEYQVRVDPQTRTDDLIAGGTDLALVPGSSWTQVGGIPTIELTTIPTGGEALIPNSSTGPFTDERLRQALLYAFDGATTAGVLFGGTQYWDGTMDCTPVPIGSPACLPGATYPQDLEKARELVADYTAQHGEPVVDYVHYAIPSFATEAQYVQSQLAQIGITANLRAVDTATHTQAQAAGDYELLQGSTASSGFPTVWSRYYSGGQNWGRGAIPALDAALLEARDAVELDDRNAAWQEVASIIRDDAVLLWIAPYQMAMAHSSDLHLGITGHPWEGSTMVYLDEAWLSR
ncbi:ABC transporter substrate-binding protein [Microbacterium sp. zg-Y818]|uniref:ABC transporter substrate-binding protein n=1 Tax=unclassified Microbacterium TaxID=2609290 RepID=UPI00214B4C41|nr:MULTISPECIES: ABC transporter substrate-binding protein [unclassified Microbacterium]MCR2799346.1 ABC transporter substrate-binding protein [Microbacterium sp. zg.Y818]WIM21346.1 ABC transporter substrate-binding protein [Microbacterium sp. zg-Y818]